MEKWVQHDRGLFWTDANGVPWSTKYIACTDDECATDTLGFLWAGHREGEK